MKKNFDVRTAATIAAATLLPMVMSTPVFADNISSSTIGVGITNLLNDLSTYVVILSPTVGGLAAVYFVIRRGMADEQDGKLWEKRIRTAVICGVAGALIGGIIKLIASYF